MNKLWLTAFISLSLYASVDYRPIGSYAQLTYNVLQEFTTAHQGCSAKEVREYLRSGAIRIVIADANYMGYSERRVLKCTYQLALKQQPVNITILEALKAQAYEYLVWKEIYRWGVLGCAGFSALASIGLMYATGRMYREFLRT
jgi:hypothetical protein